MSESQALRPRFESLPKTKDRFRTSHQVAAILDELVMAKNLQITLLKHEPHVFELISYLGHLPSSPTYRPLLLGHSNCLLYLMLQ